MSCLCVKSLTMFNFVVIMIIDLSLVFVGLFIGLLINYGKEKLDKATRKDNRYREKIPARPRLENQIVEVSKEHVSKNDIGKLQKDNIRAIRLEIVDDGWDFTYDIRTEEDEEDN